MDQVVFDYLNPKVPAGLRLVDVPLVRATEQSIAGYGEIAHTRDHRIEIVPWPLAGWRKLDAGTGIEGGTTEGIFACEWRGNELLGRNEAVGGHYVIGFRERPEQAAAGVALAGDRVLLWHCNYHPDGGQLFFPLDGTPFVVPVARPGDDLKARGLHRAVVRRQLRYLHPSRHLARRRLSGRDHRPLLRQAGQGACARELRPRQRARRAAQRSAAEGAAASFVMLPR